VAAGAGGVEIEGAFPMFTETAVPFGPIGFVSDVGLGSGFLSFEARLGGGPGLTGAGAGGLEVSFPSDPIGFGGVTGAGVYFFFS
jgi:hypothetical protein